MGYALLSGPHNDHKAMIDREEEGASRRTESGSQALVGSGQVLATEVRTS